MCVRRLGPFPPPITLNLILARDRRARDSRITGVSESRALLKNPTLYSPVRRARESVIVDQRWEDPTLYSQLLPRRGKPSSLLDRRELWLGAFQFAQAFFCQQAARAKVWHNLISKRRWLKRVSRRPKHRRPFKGDSGADTKWPRRRMNPERCPWWPLLRDDRAYDQDNRFGKLFREKFRVPRQMFDTVVARARCEPCFSDACSQVGPRGTKGSPKGPKRDPGP